MRLEPDTDTRTDAGTDANSHASSDANSDAHSVPSAPSGRPLPRARRSSSESGMHKQVAECDSTHAETAGHAGARLELEGELQSCRAHCASLEQENDRLKAENSHLQDTLAEKNKLVLYYERACGPLCGVQYFPLH